eukprot:1642441-Prymnesium_polylepis.1
MAAAARGQLRAAVGRGESGDGAHGLAMPRAVPLCHSCHLSPRCRGGWCPRATQSIRCEHA